MRPSNALANCAMGARPMVRFAPNWPEALDDLGLAADADRSAEFAGAKTVSLANTPAS